MDFIVGVSAGAIVGAFYAAVGLSIESMIEEARTFRGRHVILHGVALRVPRFERLLKPFCGIVPSRLEQLENASFDRLHHGIRALGIVCHDLLTARPMYFATGACMDATLAEAVRASATIPGVIPSRVVRRGGRTLRLADGGISDSLPVDFARSQPLGGTHLIISDCRRIAAGAVPTERDVYIRPVLRGVGMLRSPGETLLDAVARGEQAVTDDVLQQIRAWRNSRSGGFHAATEGGSSEKSRAGKYRTFASGC
jgi:predicted acylesterase/phospholipase RssA